MATPRKMSDPDAGTEWEDSLDGFVAAPATPGDWLAWRNLWQFPVLLVSAVLIGLGVRTALLGNPGNLVRDIARVEQLIVQDELADARVLIRTRLEPNVSHMLPVHRGRYHAAVADWIAVSQDDTGIRDPRRAQDIAEQYGLAEAWGRALNPYQLDRWARAALDLDDHATARAQLEAIEGHLTGDTAADQPVRALRNGLLRTVIERNLLRSPIDLDRMTQELNAYRSDPLLDGAALAWVATTRARLCLEDGRPGDAERQLSLELRRLEDGRVELPPALRGELMTVLGRAYADLGDYGAAADQLELALGHLPKTVPAYGETQYFLGLLAAMKGEDEEAYERFDAVVRDFDGTVLWGRALLERAKVNAKRGDYAASLLDFFELQKGLRSEGARPIVPRREVAEALIDLTSESIVLDELDRAAEFIEVANGLYAEGDEKPAEILKGLAGVTRARADARWSSAAVESDGGGIDQEAARARREARALYRDAGAAFEAWADAIAADQKQDDVWGEAMRSAGVCYDLAGYQERAIRVLESYNEKRSAESDPYWTDAHFLLAQAYQATEDFEAAVSAYEAIRTFHPKSVRAYASIVPLSQCLQAVGEREKALAILEQTVNQGRSGRVPGALGPDAPEYQAAVAALGTMFWESGRFTEAITRLDEALQRYEADGKRTPEVNDVRFRLADAYFRHAQFLLDSLDREGTTMKAEERSAREILVGELTENAVRYFGDVIEAYGRETRLTRPSDSEQRLSAMILRADATYDLGRFEGAQRFYDQVLREYPDHPAAIHAVVQIVNCFDRMGKHGAADIAHANALELIKTMGDDAFDQHRTLFDRGAWQEWVRRRPFFTAGAQDE